MTISIVESVSVTGDTLTFTQPILQNDVVVVAMRVYHPGTGVFSTQTLADGVTSTGFTVVGSTPHVELAWRQFFTPHAGSWQFYTSGVSGVELIGLHLSNDVTLFTVAGVDEFLLDGGGPVTTDFADDPVIVVSSEESGIGGFSESGDYTLHASHPGMAMWLHDPFLVPLGTTLEVNGTGATNYLSGMAMRPWSKPPEPEPTPVAAWQLWIVD